MVDNDSRNSEAEAKGDVELAEGATEPADEEGVDELQELRDELEAAQAHVAEYLDGWQRAQAAFSNYKKRQEAERAQMIQLSNATLVRKLLPVGDDFDRAIATLPACLDQLTWVDGLFLIKHKLDAVLQSEGVKPIETQGEQFDPLYHEAITYEEAEGFAEGYIIGEVQRGYILGDRVLRPSLVRVAKAPPVARESEAENGDADEEESGG